MSNKFVWCIAHVSVIVDSCAADFMRVIVWGIEVPIVKLVYEVHSDSSEKLVIQEVYTDLPI